MANQSFAIRSLPQLQNAYLAVNDVLTLTVDARLRAIAVRIDNGCQRALSIETNVRPRGLAAAVVSPGTQVLSFTQGVYVITLTNDQAGAVAGSVSVYVSDEELPDTSEVSSDSAKYAAYPYEATGSINVVDSFTQTTIIPVTANQRIRMLGYCIQGTADATGAAGGVGTSQWTFDIRTSGADIFGEMQALLRHDPNTTVNFGAVCSGFIPIPAPGYVLPAGFSLLLEMIHATVAGTAPAGRQARATAIVLATIEPVS
jgi:hypothetical protein